MIALSSETQQQILTESIPWRNGTIEFAIGETVLDKTPMDCFILNNLRWLFKLNPSFMLCFPKDRKSIKPFVSIIDKGSETNGFIIVSKQAQNLGYSKIDIGQCKAKTYFFGRKKPERTFDLFLRFAERGFSISNIMDIELFNGDETFDITTKKTEYSKSSFRTGKVIVSPLLGKKGNIILPDENMHQIPCRIRHS